MNNLIKRLAKVCHGSKFELRQTERVVDSNQKTSPLLVEDIAGYIQNKINLNTDNLPKQYLCVLDKKDEQNSFRFVLYDVKTNVHTELDSPTNIVPIDLEAISIIPNRKHEYIAMESSGRSYHIKLEMELKKIKVLSTFVLPEVEQITNSMGGLESLSLFEQDNKLYIMYGSRGGANNKQAYKYLPWYCIRTISISTIVPNVTSIGDNTHTTVASFVNDAQIHVLGQASATSSIREMSDACFMSQKDYFYRTSALDHDDVLPTEPLENRINKSWLWKQQVGNSTQSGEELLLYVKGIKLEAIFTDGQSDVIDFATDNDVENGTNYFGRFHTKSKTLELIALSADLCPSGMAPVCL